VRAFDFVLKGRRKKPHTHLGSAELCKALGKVFAHLAEISVVGVAQPKDSNADTRKMRWRQVLVLEHAPEARRVLRRLPIACCRAHDNHILFLRQIKLHGAGERRKATTQAQNAKQRHRHEVQSNNTDTKRKAPTIDTRCKATTQKTHNVKKRHRHEVSSKAQSNDTDTKRKAPTIDTWCKAPTIDTWCDVLPCSRSWECTAQQCRRPPNPCGAAINTPTNSG
jgi:hypothetical protein